MSDKRSQKRVPIVLRIKLRYEDVGTFIDKFAVNLSRGGMFIASRSPKAPGTEVKFELKLADQSTVVSGTGIVRWKCDFDPAKPRALHGMGIEFLKLDPGSEAVLSRVLDHRRELGLPDDMSIPHATPAATAARAAEPPPAPAKVARAPQPRTPAPPPPPIPAAKAPPPPPPSEEPAAELAAASEPPAPSTPSVDEALAAFLDVGVDSALARARALAQATLGDAPADDELDRLLKVSATPAATSVDAASDELAAILGGDAVHRFAHGPEHGTATSKRDDEDEEPEEEEGETVVASRLGAGSLVDNGAVEAALDALESGEVADELPIAAPVIASAPTEDQLEAALSEIDDDELSAPPLIDRPALPGLAPAVPVDDEDDDEPRHDMTYSAPLDAKALSADELLSELDEPGSHAGPVIDIVPSPPTRKDASDIDSTLAALEFDDRDSDDISFDIDLDDD